MTFTKLPKAITAEELLSTPLPPVKWIIPGLLPAGLAFSLLAPLIPEGNQFYEVMNNQLKTLHLLYAKGCLHLGLLGPNWDMKHFYPSIYSLVYLMGLYHC